MKYYARFENIVTSPGRPDEPVVAGPFDEFIQLTYGLLRVGPDGNDLAHLFFSYGPYNCCWEYNGNFYSDVVLYATPDEP